MQLRLLLGFAATILIAVSAHTAATHVEASEISWACGFGGGGQKGHPDNCGIDPLGGSEVESRGDPQFAKKSWLDSDDEILGLTINGQTKAYPIRMLVRHEIVNDEIGGTPVAVTFCPLCGSGIALDRSLNGEIIDLAPSGFLWQHDMVMWDPTTNTLWNQITGRAIGTLVDETVTEAHPDVALQTIHVVRATWQKWLADNPGTLLLQPNGNNYGSDPYESRGYYNNCDLGISGASDCDIDGLGPKAQIVGITSPTPLAFDLLGVLRQGGVAVSKTPSGTFVAAAQPDGAATVYAAGNYSFSKDAAGFWVDQDGRPWVLQSGQTASGSEQLDELDSYRMFWFAWQGHYPETELWMADEGNQTTAPDLEDNGRLPGFWLPAIAVILVITALFWRARNT